MIGPPSLPPVSDLAPAPLAFPVSSFPNLSAVQTLRNSGVWKQRIFFTEMCCVCAPRVPV